MNGMSSWLGNQAGQAGNAPFGVAEIPGASGTELHTSPLGYSIVGYFVSFAKGNTAFLEVIATESGDLTSATAISVANQQFASAPDIPASGSKTNWHLLPGVPVVGAVLCVVIFVIGRKRKYPEALRGFRPRRQLGSDRRSSGPSGPWASYPPPAAPVSNEEHPKVRVEQWQ